MSPEPERPDLRLALNWQKAVNAGGMLSALVATIESPFAGSGEDDFAAEPFRLPEALDRLIESSIATNKPVEVKTWHAARKAPERGANAAKVEMTVQSIRRRRQVSS
jgi:hypothetical protein